MSVWSLDILITVDLGSSFREGFACGEDELSRYLILMGRRGPRIFRGTGVRRAVAVSYTQSCPVHL
jgi:hypothetical protein